MMSSVGTAKVHNKPHNYNDKEQRTRCVYTSHSLQNSMKKRDHSQSITARLDSTEHLLKQMNHKFDKIKLQIDLSKIKPKNVSTLKMSKAIKSAKENCKNYKMKSLIEKILDQKDKDKDTDEQSFTLSSPVSSNKDHEYRPSESTLAGEKSDSIFKYDQIIEESSEMNESQISNEQMANSKMSIENSEYDQKVLQNVNTMDHLFVLLSAHS